MKRRRHSDIPLKTFSCCSKVLVLLLPVCCTRVLFVSSSLCVRINCGKPSVPNVLNWFTGLYPANCHKLLFVRNFILMSDSKEKRQHTREAHTFSSICNRCSWGSRSIVALNKPYVFPSGQIMSQVKATVVTWIAQHCFWIDFVITGDTSVHGIGVVAGRGGYGSWKRRTFRRNKGQKKEEWRRSIKWIEWNKKQSKWKKRNRGI